MRLLTLTGTGGAGKTRLAIAVADSLASEFDDGACFVDLSAIRDPAPLMPNVAHAFGLTNWGREPVMSCLPIALHSKHTLLVLDNFEQVLPAAHEVSELACPNLVSKACAREQEAKGSERCEYASCPHNDATWPARTRARLSCPTETSPYRRGHGAVCRVSTVGLRAAVAFG